MSPTPSPAERRQEPRLAASGRLRIVVKSGHVFEADLVDRSLKGMRVRLADAAALPGDVSVLSLDGAAIYEARVMWRTPPFAGLLVVRTVDMRSPASAHDPAHKLWREHARR